MTLIDKVLAILEKTHDGDDLTPEHLKLTEYAVNGFLNESGIEKIEEIYQAVKNGTYERPAYLGVKYMDRDHEGYVYFKGQEVEHYSSFWAYSLDAKTHLKCLQQRCLFLEAKGVPVTRALQCSWSMGGEYAEEFCTMQKEKLDTWVKSGAILFSVIKTEHDSFLMPGHPDYDKVRKSPQYKDICSFRYDAPRSFSVSSYVYGTGKMWRHASEEELDCIHCCFDFLKDTGCLEEISLEKHMVRQEQQEMDSEEPWEDDYEI